MPSINQQPERPRGFRYDISAEHLVVQAEIPGSPDWRFAVEYRPSSGGWVLARLEIFPNESEQILFVARDDSRDERIRRPVLGTPPLSGITTKELRNIPLSRLPEWVSSIRGEEFGLNSDSGVSFLSAITGASSADFKARPRPGRFGRDDLPYAQLARDYLEVCAVSRSPIVDLTALQGYREGSTAVRDALVEARRRGLLESSGRGRQGGRLTPKAVAVLEGVQDGEEA
jgi:hypothetical protein